MTSESLNDSAEVIRHGLDMAEIFLIKNAHALNAPPVLSAIKEAQAVIAVMGDVNDTNVASKDKLIDCIAEGLWNESTINCDVSFEEAKKIGGVWEGAVDSYRKSAKTAISIMRDMHKKPDNLNTSSEHAQGLDTSSTLNGCRQDFDQYCIQADFGKGESGNYADEWPTYWKIWQAAWNTRAPIKSSISKEWCMKMAAYVGAPACFALEQACQHINQAFDSYGCYIVGSALERQDWRDVDVRMIMADEEFYKLFPDAQSNGNWEFDSRWLLMTASMSQWLSKMTGLPIDFQFQPQTHANEYHKGLRNAVGLRITKSKVEEGK